MSAASAWQEVEEKVRGNCVVVYTRSTCGPCKVVKRLFDKTGVRYQAVALDKCDHGNNLAQALVYKTGMNTVPQVFINGACVGGAQETTQLHRAGRLRELIAECDPTFK